MVLHRLGKFEPELLDRLNKLLSVRSGRHRVKFSYNQSEGLTLYCADHTTLPRLLPFLSTYVYETTEDGRLLKTIKSGGAIQPRAQLLLPFKVNT